jgi:hypothetical protein
VNAHLADHSPILRRHRLLEHWAREKGSVTRATVSADGEAITVHIPLTFRKRGGRKLIVTPDGAAWAPRPRVDNAMVKAVARAFRWRKMLDTGVHATLDDLAPGKGRERDLSQPYLAVDAARAGNRGGDYWRGRKGSLVTLTVRAVAFGRLAAETS